MDRERYADRYPLGGSLGAIAPGVRTSACSQHDADYPGPLRREQVDSISSNRSTPSSHAPRSPNPLRRGTHSYSSYVRSRQALEHRDSNEHNTRVPYNRECHFENDNPKIDHYRNSTTYRERETQQFAPVNSPSRSSWSHVNQRERRESNTSLVLSHMNATHTRYGSFADSPVVSRQGTDYHKVFVDHNRGLWYAEGDLYGNNNGRHEIATNESGSQKNATSCRQSGQERRRQGGDNHRDNSSSEESSSDEESQYDREAYYYEMDETSNSSDGCEDSMYFDDEDEEDPDQYASDGGFDEEGEPDDGFDDDDDDDDY
ncbi:hypothetical protein F5Y12DRAFT_710000 [Xylaria sp. FL1777]|nr:hypothetical protein F5Y12DRAFT_710000 [Xylaria sp. FL1777]